MDELMEEEQEQIRKASNQKRLEWILHILSNKEREAITLTSKGLKRREIAKKMAITDESAKTLIKRARKKAATLSPK
jgi:DNA-directed RNA polymerase specialized sigma24 family protein